MTNKTLPKAVIRLFFILGVISAISMRLIVILNKFDRGMARLFWYIGVVGYIFFFGYRFYIAKRRRDAINKNQLIEKVLNSSLVQEDKDNIEYILNSIVKSKEIFNYIFIFALSIVAIIIDITLEIIL